MNKKFYGFTLIEAIISICILTILSTIGFISYSGYTKDSRDANRITTIANIQESIEQIKMKNSKVPSPEKITGNGFINGIELFKVGIIGDELSGKLNLSNTPQDPLNKNNYSYGVTKNNKEYQIATILENKSTLGIIQKTYADFDNAISKVNGNYDGLITYNSGGSCLVNTPSLIVSTGGTFDVSTTDPGYVVDKGENIPFLQNSKKIVKENKQNIVLKKTNSQTGGIAGICNINFATQSGSLRYVFGESGKKIGENLGILVKEEPKIDKPIVCETDLTQTNIDNLNAFFSGSTYSGSTKDYWCGLTDITYSKAFTGSLIEDMMYLTNLQILKLSDNNFTDISSIKNLNKLTKLWLVNNYNLKDITINSKVLNFLRFDIYSYNYGKIENIKIKNATSLSTFMLLRPNNVKINIELNNVTNINNFLINTDTSNSSSGVFTLFAPNLSNIQTMDLNSTNRITNDYTDLSKFNNVKIGSSLKIARSDWINSNPGHAMQQYFVNNANTGSVFCNSIIGKLYVYNGAEGLNTTTLYNDYSPVCR